MNKDKIERLNLLNEECKRIDTIIDAYNYNHNKIKEKINPDKLEFHKLREQITYISMLKVEYSKQECEEEEDIEKRRVRVRILEDIIIELIKKRDNVTTRLKENEKEMASWLLSIKSEKNKREEVRREVKSILLFLDNSLVNKIPYEFRYWYKALRARGKTY